MSLGAPSAAERRRPPARPTRRRPPTGRPGRRGVPAQTATPAAARTPADTAEAVAATTAPEPARARADIAAGRAPAARTQSDAKASPAGGRLVGRAAERARLLGSWPAEAGAPAVACVLGEPGIGKSRLVDDVARALVRRGALALRASAYAAEGQLNYGPVVEWLRSPAIAARVDDLEAPWREHLARLLPEFARAADAAQGASTDARGGPDRYSRRQLFEAVARALLDGDQAIVLVLDDLQWCDDETLALLHYLGRHAARRPAMVLLTARVDELDDNAPARALVSNLRQDGRLVDVELAPLDDDDVAELVRAAAHEEGSDATEPEVARAVALAEGNPLFALEALRAERSGGALGDAGRRPCPGRAGRAGRARPRAAVAARPGRARRAPEAVGGVRAGSCRVRRHHRPGLPLRDPARGQ